MVRAALRGFFDDVYTRVSARLPEAVRATLDELLVVALATPTADLLPRGTFDKVNVPLLIALLLILVVSCALGLATVRVCEDCAPGAGGDADCETHRCHTGAEPGWGLGPGTCSVRQWWAPAAPIGRFNEPCCCSVDNSGRWSQSPELCTANCNPDSGTWR
jgi:hypothetical protein